ncbi:prohormone-2-like isoform X2 [Copidosoma floridanum]|uniref:prohormone-2-like isoform X2 n=1 Tax=Copidosoma floridanum TaxID=29053 RepID=UPI0006C9B136|nr:prohormone-2-like isoform X2 [Copidosoma floridanum]
MYSEWMWFLGLSAILVAVQALPTAGLADEAKKSEQPARPKVKRSQELLMFGNQQNQRAAADRNAPPANIAPSLEKRTLSNSGLEDASAVLSEAEQRPEVFPGTYIMDQPAVPQRDNNYEYGRVLVNELDDVFPRNSWDRGPQRFGRNYAVTGLSAEERRKRSGDSSSPTTTTTLAPASPSSSFASIVGTAPPSPAVAGPSKSSALLPQLPPAQPKRSIPTYYPEIRYKRESDVDPDKQLYALLQLYNSEHRNRGNWRNYGNDEYENIEDESNLMGLDDEDPSAGSWLDNSIGYPQQPNYLSAEPLLSSELAALGRAARPLGYYEQYLNQQQQQPQYAGQQYDAAGVQYGTPQYGLPQYSVHGSYYPPEKRFMVSRKRSQNYDSYGGRSGYLVGSRGYPTYNQHRLLY